RSCTAQYLVTLLDDHPTAAGDFFFNDPATTEIYTLSLHDALPICGEHRFHRRRRQSFLLHGRRRRARQGAVGQRWHAGGHVHDPDRKSTRLNSSHVKISYAVFCLKKKTNKEEMIGSTGRLKKQKSR